MDQYLFLIPIAIALIIGVISPGPSFIMVAQTAMQKTRPHGIATSLGMGTGAMTFALLASFGLFFILETVPWLYLILKLVGGAYLAYLAYKIWMSADAPLPTADLVDDGQSLIKSYLLGLFTQLSNPKTAIVISGIFMAFLPAEPPEYSHLLLALLAFIIDAGWYTLVSLALTTSKAQRIYAKFKAAINRTASGLLGFMGGKLVFD